MLFIWSEKEGKDKHCHHTYSNHTESPSQCNKAGEKRYMIGKEGRRGSYSHTTQYLHIIPKNLQKKSS